MKFTFILFSFLFGAQICAQNIEELPISTLGKAKIQLDQNHIFFNPTLAFLNCKKAAEEEQDTEAMNLLGVLYSQGIGIDINMQEALKWFNEAAEKGYPKSWYNVGLMYQNGYGTVQNFEKAFEYYSKGSEIGYSSSMYGKGYLHYKGLGCKQSYPEAVKLFKKAVINGSLGSMYLLGLCYRNGYGIQKDQDSARFWLTKATGYGYELARREMMEANPESNDYKQTNKSNSLEKYVNEDLIKETFEKVTHQLGSVDEISGKYSGYIVTYDWSGQHIISKDILELDIVGSEGKNLFKGEWVENNNLSATISGKLIDSKVVFENTSYFKKDHYSSQTPIEFLFNEAKFTSVSYDNSKFLLGNLQLWDVKRNEPEKPMYISLTKNEDLKSLTTVNNDLTIFPNPFENSFSFDLKLEIDTEVFINLFSMNGSVLYSEKLKLPKGTHRHSINVNVASGSYILKVAYGGENKSTLIIKS